MRRGIAVALFGTTLFLAGCPSTISQDAKSGKDKRPSGAKPITIGDDGEGQSEDIVSYPGGDRVDWKVFEVKAPSDITVAVKWTPPREGLDIAFNLLDEGGNVLERAKPSPGSGKSKKEVDVKGKAPGKYFVQIYAPERGDAAEYRVEVSVRKAVVADTTGMPDTPFPPRLAMLPGPACPPGTPPEKCGPPPGPCPPGAAAGMTCVCPPGGTPPPCPPPPPPCPPGAPGGTACICKDGVTPPPCPVEPVVLWAQITEYTVAGQGVNITLNKGQNAKVDKGCMGVVFRGTKGEKELANSRFTINDVTPAESRANIPKISADEIAGNRRAKLTCIPKGP